MRIINMEPTSKPPYFVATSELGTPKTKTWVKTKATTLDGAKRLAAKLQRSLTTSAQVAIEDPKGGFKTVATLEDFSAITGRRATWRNIFG